MAFNQNKESVSLLLSVPFEPSREETVKKPGRKAALQVADLRPDPANKQQDQVKQKTNLCSPNNSLKLFCLEMNSSSVVPGINRAQWTI